ncbi:hypothetical protein QBC35DRAFT_537649 [Podospora australis]|uniref:Putative gamma-glutamylcyclotransferase n=1 Tax=Podospora australis TaxID=1536484 RepID=A0AAN7AED3_9PEZI|nr:hypothetical protein QBC35DRAFT_537649 [Podospora australis]
MVTQPTPIFIYGTLCALPWLSCLLTGDAANVDAVSPLLRRATAREFRRHSVWWRIGEIHGDAPAAVASEDGMIDGYLLTLQTTSQRQKIDDFEGEGESYKRAPVIVDVLRDDGSTEEQIQANIYVWNGDPKKISSDPWDLDTFINERLQNWLDLFAGAEFVGEDETPEAGK